MNELTLPTASHWICPLCREPLRQQDRTYRCTNGHSFDQAKEGYVHLLPVQRKHSANPGDDKQMLRSRREFLELGHYRPLADKVAECCVQAATNGPIALLDTGCGEGYYTAIIAAALGERRAWTAGIDIAKDAVRMAAKRYPDIDFAVASTAALPVEDHSLDVITRIFAPGTDSELVRSLRSGGLFIEVTPAAMHLYALRALVYDQPRPHEDGIRPMEGLVHVQRITLEYPISVDGNGNVGRLLSMTPYYWQTSVEKQASIAALEHLDTVAAFHIDCYRVPD